MSYGEIPDAITVIPDNTREWLNPRQLVDYEAHRREVISWGLDVGKDPKGREGYAIATLKERVRRLNQLDEWVWKREGYTTHITHDHADDYLEERQREGLAKDTLANDQKAYKMLFKWRTHEYGWDEYEPRETYSNDGSTTTPRDYLSYSERIDIREAALEYDSIPHYNSVTPQERREWKKYLAKKFHVPIEEVGLEHWERANGWKVPSLVWASLDAGLRPVEIERARVSWFDGSDGVFRIPREDSSKTEGYWEIALKDRTARILTEWLDERSNYDEYEGSDSLWLTRDGNPYGSGMLSHILGKLCEIAGIDTGNREMSWYAIRRSTATYLIDESDLSTAQMQMRHKSPTTTMRYNQSPVENRKKVVDKLG